MRVVIITTATLRPLRLTSLDTELAAYPLLGDELTTE